MSKRCSVDGCMGEVRARGYCNSHYAWARKRDFEEEPEHLINRQGEVDRSNWSDRNLMWVAGILEGEGSCGVWNGKPSLVVGMCDFDVVERLHNIVGFGHTYVEERDDPHKDCMHWRSQSAKCLMQFIPQVYPEMGSRRQDQMDCVLDRCREMVG